MLTRKLPEWTEIGSQTGLDPLGMMRPSELIYQPLLSGISTVTNRLRYYSFLPWVCHFYAKEYSDKNLNNFRKVLRHAEALYALLGYVGQVDRGLTGSNWVSRFLSANTDNNTLDFGEPARDLENGLLQNQGGALGAIYGAQISEMGLLKRAEEHDIMVPTALGVNVASAFEKALGEHKGDFIKAIQEGRIERTKLEALKFLRPSEIISGSDEWALLKNALFGLGEYANKRAEPRRDSLKRMLQYAKIMKSWPSPDAMRWEWYNTQFRDSVPDNWLAYHINDLLIFGYESVFKYCLDLMRAAPDRTISWQSLLSRVLGSITDLDAPFLSGIQLDGTENDQASEVMKMSHETALLSQRACQISVVLIRKTLRWADQHEEFIRELFRHDNYFHSIRTELNFVKSLDHRDTGNVLSSIVSERIIKRHLWVAARKFRSDSKYTFLFEPAESSLRYKKAYRVGIGYPRIAPALQYLADLNLIEEDVGLTPLGQKVLKSL